MSTGVAGTMGAADFEFSPGFSYPSEFNYNLPTQIPPGLRQVQLRQVNYSNIPSPTPPGTEIIIQIPQLDYSFLDPITTSLNVRGFLTIQLNAPIANTPIGQYSTNSTSITGINGPPNSSIIPANSFTIPTENYGAGGFATTCTSYPTLGQLSFAPHAILGKGWGMFRRYQVYLNGNQLTDDIEQIGIVHNYMQLLTTSRGYDSSMLEQNNVGSGLGGTNYSFLFPTQPAAMKGTFYSNQYSNLGRANATTTNTYVGYLDGCKSDLKRQYVKSGYGSQSVLGLPSDYDSTTGRYVIPFEFSLPLMGMLGMHNDKMIPLFMGPIKVQLYTEDLNVFIQQNNALSLANSVQGQYISAAGNTSGGALGIDGSINYSLSTISYTQLEIVGNYVRCDGAAFQQILSALPIPGKMVLRSGSFTFSAAQLSASAQGVYDLLIPSRRASSKFIMTLCTNSSLAGKSYASVCPFLTNGTCIMINGIQYPQQGKDFLNKPRDSYRQTLVALNLAYTSVVRPAILPQNWLRLSTSAINWQGISQGAISSTSDQQLRTLNPNFSLLRLKHVFQDGNTAYTQQVNTSSGGVGIFPVPSALATADANQTSVYFYADGVANTSFVTTIPYWQDAVLDTETNIDETNNLTMSGPSNQPIVQSYLQNQWVDITDTEVFGRRQFLSGQSTLSGSCFYHANIGRQLPAVDHNFLFFMYFDAITIFDATTKQVVWKI